MGINIDIKEKVAELAKIPKRVFYCWGANESKRPDVELCIQTWKHFLPDYEIIEINEDSIDYFNFQEELKNNKWFKTVYDRKMYAYVSDYIRIKTLYEHGGIYFDTDVSVIKSLDKFLNEPAFVGIQSNSQDIDDDLVEPAILGSQKNNPLFKEILAFYDNEIWEMPIYTMPQIFEHFLQKNYGITKYPSRAKQKILKVKDITIYPERYFIPFRWTEKFTPKCIKEDTHTIHWFGGSWCDKKTMYFLRNKHQMALDVIDKHANNKDYPCNIDPTDLHPHKITVISVFNIPFLKIDEFKHKIKIYLFKVIPLLRIKYWSHKTKYYLFTLIPFLKTQKFENKLKIYLFCLLPILKIQTKKDKKNICLFSFGPILTIKQC